jgi:hypothetical protein
LTTIRMRKTVTISDASVLVVWPLMCGNGWGPAVLRGNNGPP